MAFLGCGVATISFPTREMLASFGQGYVAIAACRDLFKKENREDS